MLKYMSDFRNTTTKTALNCINRLILGQEGQSLIEKKAQWITTRCQQRNLVNHSQVLE